MRVSLIVSHVVENVVTYCYFTLVNFADALSLEVDGQTEQPSNPFHISVRPRQGRDSVTPSPNAAVRRRPQGSARVVKGVEVYVMSRFSLTWLHVFCDFTVMDVYCVVCCIVY